MGFPQLRSGGYNLLAGLTAENSVDAQPAAYTVTGEAATLIYSGATGQMSVLPKRAWRGGYPRAFHPSHQKPFRFHTVVPISLSVDSGSFAITGTAATLSVTTLSNAIRVIERRGTWPRHFAPSPFGQLRSSRFRTRDLVTSIPVQYSLPAEEWAVVISGTVANLEYHRVLDVIRGQIFITGTPVNFDTQPLSSPGSYTITGTAAGLRKDKKISAATYGVVITGLDAALLSAVAVFHETIQLSVVITQQTDVDVQITQELSKSVDITQSAEFDARLNIYVHQ